MAVKTIPAVVNLMSQKINNVARDSHLGHRLQKLSTCNIDHPQGGTCDIYLCHTDNQVLVLDAS